MEKFDVLLSVRGQQICLRVVLKKDTVIEGIYSIYQNGVWLANIYKNGQMKYEAISYTKWLTKNDIAAISRKIDSLINNGSTSSLPINLPSRCAVELAH